MIELTDVSFSYEGRRALNGVSLKIEKGESLCLLGPNGSGKSTLLKLLNGLVLPDEGLYRFDGDVIDHKSLKDPAFAKAFHRKLGFVFQNPDTQLFCTTVYDEIAFGPRQMGLDEQEADRRVRDCLKLLDLGGFDKRQPYHLSGGEKRKVSIACVLAMNPQVLVLDEPMNGLDPRSARHLAGFLAELGRAGKTVVTATHSLDMVGEISHRAVLFGENHAIAADLQTDRLLADVELLIETNLVDEYYHRHSDGGHTHFHSHNY